jgi:hypothetical protein
MAPDPDSVVLPPLESTHYSLEIIESRIRDGTDTQNFHPALSISLVPTYNFGKLSPFERGAKTHYEPRDDQRPFPTFWEPRVWDSAGARLSRADSERLRARLAFLSSRAFLAKRKKKEKAPSSDEFDTGSGSESPCSDDEEFTGDEAESGPEPVADGSAMRTRIRTRSSGPAPMPERESPPPPVPRRRSIFLRIPTNLFSTDDDEDATD